MTERFFFQWSSKFQSDKRKYLKRFDSKSDKINNFYKNA